MYKGFKFEPDFGMNCDSVNFIENTGTDATVTPLQAAKSF